MSASPEPGRYPLRLLADDDWDQFVATDSQAFGFTAPAGVMELEREVHEPGRGLGAFDGPTAVGIATAFSYRVTVPGGALPAAGISWVGVLPTHRRLGILRALMTRQLHDVHDRGEPLAVLWASEPMIYGRYGYGIATYAFEAKVPRSADALFADAPRDPILRVRLVAPDDWKLTQPVYDAAVAARPGMLARDDRWWRRAVRDLPDRREGRSELRCVVAEDGSDVRAYARYATKPDWGPGVPSGTVFVREIMSVDPAARAAVFRFLLDLDLMATTDFWNLPVDDPLFMWLRNARGGQPRWTDALHVRLVDLPVALSGRTYSAPVEVVLEVRDAVCPWNAGTWRLTGGPDGAQCERSDDAADLALDVRELGAAYLGGTTLVDLGGAGRVEERTAGALAVASAAFRHQPAPWCPIVF
jgi:predicted acetyltransferase